MKTIISKIDINNIDKEELKKQAKLLCEGNTVIFPTETVYGLGANALDEDAVIKIYEAKGRPSDNPLIVHICEKSEVYNLAKDISEKAELIMDEFWPGPITIILNKKDIVPYRTSGGLDTVAIRMPSHPIAREIIKQSGLPIAAPSANISGRPSPTKAEHVYEEMNGRVSGIVLGDDCNYGLESTVLDMTGDIPMILRPGYITKDMLEKVLGEVAIDKTILDVNCKEPPKAPGMRYRHYAPKGQLTIVEGDSANTIATINALTKEAHEKGEKVGIIGTEETKDLYIGDSIKSVGKRRDEEAIARTLYTILREFDDEDVSVIYSESFAECNMGQAIMNRLLKAAGHQIIQV